MDEGNYMGELKKITDCYIGRPSTDSNTVPPEYNLEQFIILYFIILFHCIVQ
jgi:hypothetical protein